MRDIKSIKNKALSLNLDATIYGTIAEIGGGQEVARNFFQAGGASGTVAKTISAYDKTFSDMLYNAGKPGRHVDEHRIVKMLEKEFSEIVRTLVDSRGSTTSFFVFANTVETLNYHKTNQGHGWIGVRFQLNPGAPPNEVLIHVNLLENDGLLQQYTLGALGINLIFACFHYHDKPNTFLQSLMDNLDSDRVDINFIRMSGHDLDYIDNRLLSVQLVKNGMTVASMFDRKGQVQQPSDMLYRKNVIVLRGSFRPITYVGFDMLKTSYGLFKKDPDYQKDNTIVLCEMSLNNLLSEGDIDERDFLDRVDLLNGMGQNVMVSSFFEFYKLSRYFSNFRIRNLRMVIGVNILMRVLEPDYYKELKGGILEAFGLLFNKNTQMYVYPYLKPGESKLIQASNMPVPANLRPLFQYLFNNGFLIDLKNFRKESLGIFSWDVLQKIRSGDHSWENEVPKYISDKIKSKQLFGFKQ